MNIQIGDIVATVGYDRDNIGVIINKLGIDQWNITWIDGVTSVYDTADIYWLLEGWERLQAIGKAAIL